MTMIGKTAAELQREHEAEQDKKNPLASRDRAVRLEAISRLIQTTSARLEREQREAERWERVREEHERGVK